MSQTNVDYSDNPTGPELMDDYLDKDQENRLTTNSGIQRPTYAKAGTFWINNSANPWVLYFYNGSVDIPIGTIGTGSSGTFNVEGVDLSNYVDRSTNQTVGGSKTFTSDLLTNSSFVISKTNITKGTNPSYTQYWQFFFSDKNGIGDANTLGKIQTFVDSAGLVQTSIVAYKNASGSTNEKIAIYYPATGNPYTYAPTPATSDNSTKIATTAYVKAQGYSTTDTKNTAGSTDTSSKIFLVGATSQAANPQTYSHDTVYVNSSGQLVSSTPASSTNSTVVATTAFVKSQNYLTTTTKTVADSGCTFVISNGLKIITAEINAGGSSDYSWSYGTTFSNTPKVFVTRRSSETASNDINAWVRGTIGKSSCKIFIHASGSYTFQVVAIGN